MTSPASAETNTEYSNRITSDAMEERRDRVADLLINGWSARRIARHMGYSNQTISSDVKAIRQQWATNQTHSYQEWVTRELEKLDDLESKYAHRVDTGDTAAGQLILKIQERRAKYLALDAPTRVIIQDNTIQEIRALAEQLGVLETPIIQGILTDGR